MAIEVFLMKDVPNVGTEGQVVSVSDGYARNFLFPRKMAAPVTKAAVAKLAKLKQARDIEKQAILDAARRMVDRLSNVSCTIAVKTSGQDKLYGSVTAVEIAENLKTQGVELDRHIIMLENPIKELGMYNVPVKLHPEVETTLKVWVVEE
jgi:large subunit ribosomal protein L9